MKKAQILMNKPVYLDLLILEISKIVMYEFWYDYVKPKHNKKAKLCYMNTESFFVHVKTEDTYEDIAKVIEKRSDTSNSEIDHFRKEKKQKVIGLMKDELSEKK